MKHWALPEKVTMPYVMDAQPTDETASAGSKPLTNQ